MAGTLMYYAKAVAGGLIAGGTYFMSVLAPDADFAHVSLLNWVGFGVTLLGTAFGVGVVTNGPAPVKPAAPVDPPVEA